MIGCRNVKALLFVVESVQLQTKAASLTDDVHKLELKKRQLEESQDALMEEVAKLRAQGPTCSPRQMVLRDGCNKCVVLSACVQVKCMS